MSDYPLSFKDDVNADFITALRMFLYHEQFVQDMQGRFFYRGPAVKCERDELQDIIRATRIPLQWDHLGRTGLVVYPRESLKAGCDTLERA